jgi:hypothetical protein
LIIGNDEDYVGRLGDNKDRGEYDKQKKHTLHASRVQQLLPRDKQNDLKKPRTWVRLSSAHPGRATFIAPEGNQNKMGPCLRCWPSGLDWKS